MVLVSTWFAYLLVPSIASSRSLYFLFSHEYKLTFVGVVFFKNMFMNLSPSSLWKEFSFARPLVYLLLDVFDFLDCS